MYEGQISVVGHGGWNRGGGKTVLSVLEIGDQQLKRLVLPDDLANHLTPGRQSRVLVGRGLSHGLITRPFVAAVEVNGRKYKIASVLTMGIMKTLLYSLLAGPLLGSITPLLGVLACAGIVTYYAKDYVDLKRF
jgi:hypothetical protein